MPELILRDAKATIYRLSLPTPFPVGDVNCYLIRGAEVGLVDTGCASASSRRALEQQLAALGIGLDQVRTVVVTHHHPDHIGGVAALCRRGAELLLPRRTVEQRSNDPALNEVMYRFLSSLGAPAMRLEAWRRYQKQALDQASADDGACRGSRTLADGETVSVGGIELRTLATPGHALDHMCYLDPVRGIAFSGDHLLTDITPNPVLSFDAEQGYRRRRSLVEYIASLDRLARWRPRLALGGHGIPAADPMALIAYNREFIAQRSGAYREAIGAGECVPVFELGCRIFGERDDANMFLATSETVGYLDLLQDQGAIELVDRDGILCVTASR
ncbi:MAG: MBL fold metallo-hydrolase [Deltaproteobacteria bacterium]|nr:MBL fold metallo-hydrolase [Deltaproteobacteria bacterium]